MPSAAVAREGRGTGLAAAIVAYALWGVLPGYFLVLAPASAFEIVPFRILLSLVVCLLLIAATRGWRRFAGLLRRPRILGLMAVAAVLIYINWQVYVLAAMTGQVVEASLGYFINPIVTVLLGAFVLRETVRPAQWVALGIAGVAILVIAIGYGSFPWIALSLAFSFGCYGLVKKVVGPTVDAVGGLTIETAWLAPAAIVQLIVVQQLIGLEFGRHDAWHTGLMLAAGIVTTAPLLLFAAAARRLPLVTVGLVQFLAPVLQFLFGVLVLHEAMPLERWIGFGLVWVALVLLTVDMVRSSRPPRRASLEPV